MQVRSATIQDYADIKRLMIDFANNNPVEDLKQPKYNDHHVNRLLDHLTKEGIALVCENEGKVIGMLLASIQGDVWLPHIQRMTEIAWWVESEYRGTTAGARLLHEYITIGKKLTDNKIISSFTLTTLATTPDLKLQERGWESIDYNWVYRG
jgi:N-acetylglutamate synthase-like GNAT family acetyltransferase